MNLKNINIQGPQFTAQIDAGSSKKMLFGIIIGILVIALIIGGVVFFIIKSTGGMSSSKDLKTGLSATYKGLTFKEISLTSNSKKVYTNQWKTGEQMDITFVNTTGFVKVNGKVFPGLYLKITDIDTGKSSNYTDILSDATVSGVAYLRGAISPQESFTFSKPGNYLWESRLWDKKGTGEVNTKISVVVS